MKQLPYIESLFFWIEKKSEKWYYVYVLSLFSILATCQLNSIYEFKTRSVIIKWNVLLLKSQDLTNSLDFLDPARNEAKLVFRLFIPVLIRLFHLNYIKLHIIQYIVGYLLIIASFKLADKLLKDKVSASFITIGLVCTYFGKTSFYDMATYWFDGFAYFFIILGMLVSSPFLIFLFCTCAAWVDERAFMALSIVLVFQQLILIKSKNKIQFKDLIVLNSRSIAVLIAILTYVVFRLYLQTYYSMHTPLSEGLVSFNTFEKNIPFFPMGLLSFLEGFWLLYFIFSLITIKNREYLLFTLISLIVIVFSTSAGMVFDVTRSGSYLMPLIFVIIIVLTNNFHKLFIRYSLFFALAVCVMIPPYIIMNIPNKQIHLYGVVQKLYWYLFYGYY